MAQYFAAKLLKILSFLEKPDTNFLIVSMMTSSTPGLIGVSLITIIHIDFDPIYLRWDRSNINRSKRCVELISNDRSFVKSSM